MRKKLEEALRVWQNSPDGKSSDIDRLVEEFVEDCHYLRQRLFDVVGVWLLLRQCAGIWNTYGEETLFTTWLAPVEQFSSDDNEIRLAVTVFIEEW